MDERASELLDKIERGLFDGNTPVTMLLQNAMILGARVGAGELREWAQLELNGYPDADESLPDYRTIGAIIQVDAIVGNTSIRGQTISASQLPKFARDAGVTDSVRLGHSIAELEDLVSRGSDGAGSPLRFTVPGAAQIANAIDKESGQPFQHTHSLYWSTSQSTIRAVIERVRTVLAEFISELVSRRSSDDGNVPAREVEARNDSESPEVGPTSVDLAPDTVNKAINVSVHIFDESSSAIVTAGGQAVMGDNFSSISDSTIVNRSLIANSLNRLHEQGDGETAEALRLLADAVEESGNQEAAECLDSLNEELAKPESRKSVMRAMWDRIIVLLPHVASATVITTGIGNLVN